MGSLKGFLKGLGAGIHQQSGGLLGKTVKVGPYTVRVEALLGEGGFASIYRVRDNSTSAAYALKHMRLNGDREAIADCYTEVETMKKLRGSACILTMRAVAFAGPKGAETEAFLLLDLCKDSLVDFSRQRNNKLSDSVLMHIFQSVCTAVSAMHHADPPLAHRDLKAENVLQHNSLPLPTGQWVLCDFGSTTSSCGIYESSDAVMVAEEAIRKHTTPAYRAPELWDLYSRERIDTKVDIWALGCLLYFLAYGKLPFAGEAKLQILNGDFSLPESRAPAIRQLIRSLLVTRPADRPDIDAVLQQVEQGTPHPGAMPTPVAASASAACQQISGSAASETEASLRQQLQLAHAELQRVRLALSAQQDTVQQLQADNANQAALIKRLQADAGLPSSRPPPAEGSSGGWVASFEDAEAASPPAARATCATPPPATDSLDPFDPFQLNNGHAASAATFDAFVLNEPPDLQQASIAQRLQTAPHHRRSSSEPTPVESWHLHTDWL
ncbi:hypothetical protein WJX72_000236 [[Myrmecia] bisecta]|uniref:non-specific serine/threonine protein kinase n=1 Tax=[Myrmecia] bisecta TaxID=41462 RepID=A0AAW1Q2A6_9CHLO